MIQDIEPHRFHVEYTPQEPEESDVLLIYRQDQILAKHKDGRIEYPSVSDIMRVFPDIRKKAKFLFRIDDQDYYELRKPEIEEFNDWSYQATTVLREASPMWKAFAGITGYQIHTWYNDTKFCGRCGTKMRAQGVERAMECPACGKVTYPTISPAVIVGITNGNRLLLTRYAAGHSKLKNYALVAGYVEVGEVLEETVRREVMEEVGLKVKNIRYYKSQPWAFTGTILVGFFCDVDGDDTIHLDELELSEGQWFEREDIPENKLNISLTSEMIHFFKSNPATNFNENIFKCNNFNNKTKEQ